MGFVHCVLTATVCYFVCRGVCVCGGCLRRKEEWGSGVRSCVCVGGGLCEVGMGVYARKKNNEIKA